MTLEDIRYHYDLMKDALLILQTTLSSKDKGGRSDAMKQFSNEVGWLNANDAVGFLLAELDGKK